MTENWFSIIPSIDSYDVTAGDVGGATFTEATQRVFKDSSAKLQHSKQRGVAVPVISVQSGNFLVEERPNSNNAVELTIPTETLLPNELPTDGAKRCLFEELGAYFVGLCHIQLVECSASLYFSDEEDEYSYGLTVAVAAREPKPNLFKPTTEVSAVRWMDRDRLLSTDNLRRPAVHKTVGRVLTLFGLEEYIADATS